MTQTGELLVPMKLSALVVESEVIAQAVPVTDQTSNVTKGGDGRWIPPDVVPLNYAKVSEGLDSPGPPPFFGNSETNKFGALYATPSWPAADNAQARRGVYIHWVLPSMLRHAYATAPEVAFPPLPNRWLIVRFSRDTGSQTPGAAQAWVLEADTESDSNQGGSLLVPSADGNYYTGKHFGRFARLADYKPQDSGTATPTSVTALGNRTTGALPFTAFLAHNRNMLSFHDDLSDLRDASSKVPSNTTVSYLVVGWYADSTQDPLSFLPKQIAQLATPKDLLDYLKWGVDDVPPDLASRRCLFHGMVAHINYWSKEYQGGLLGYPGAPPVREGKDPDPPKPVNVGVGNSATDALIALVAGKSDSQAGADQPAAWKALEAVIHRQTTSLLGGWQEAPREYRVHQGWYSGHDAGRVWSILPREREESLLLPGRDSQASQSPPEIPAAAQQALDSLNQLQSRIDAAARRLAAYQQEYYARWWLCAHDSRSGTPQDRGLATLQKAIEAEKDGDLATTELQKLAQSIGELTNDLNEASGLQLRISGAPRFWSPRDPVLVVGNIGTRDKYVFPDPLPWRQISGVATSARVDGKPPAASQADDEDLNTLVTTKLQAVADGTCALLAEARLLEQAVAELAAFALKKATQQGVFKDRTGWSQWVDQVQTALAESKGSTIELLDKGGKTVQNLDTLVTFWGEQPWSPLYLDWQVTWYPTPQAQDATGFEKSWQFAGHDYTAAGDAKLPEKGFSLQGRSLVAPISDRLFTDPIDELKQILEGHGTSTEDPVGVGDEKKVFNPQVVALLEQYQTSWEKVFTDLKAEGIFAQTLSGFHERLMLQRDLFLPRVNPDSQFPWIAADADQTAKGLLEPFKPFKDSAGTSALGEVTYQLSNLAPPATSRADDPAFSLLGQGAFTLDHLWIVDDHCQWLDLLQGTDYQGTVLNISPHMAWPDTKKTDLDRPYMKMPPRIVQPARSSFRFTDEDPICGWVFYNYQDQALTLCDGSGQLLGELALVEKSDGTFEVRWECLRSGLPATAPMEQIVTNPTLLAFARPLVSSNNQNLEALTQVVDLALANIRPAAGREARNLFGRPLALVKASLALELYGRAWQSPGSGNVAGASGTGVGDPAIDRLSLPVVLGLSDLGEDGLIGYYKGTGSPGQPFDRIVPSGVDAGAVKQVDALKVAYVGDPVRDGVRLSTTPQTLTLLMDPHGSVHVATGILPAKTITLPARLTAEALENMELSFRVDPVLLRRVRKVDPATKQVTWVEPPAMPVPKGRTGDWLFRVPATDSPLVSPIALDPAPRLAGAAGSVRGGRLILRKRTENTINRSETSS